MGRPELPPARRRRTAMMLCQYLGVEPSQKQVELIADVLLAGELDFALACHRHGKISKTITGFRGWWEALAIGLQNKLDSLAYLRESFIIKTEISEATLKDLVRDPNLPLGDSDDIPLAKEND